MTGNRMESTGREAQRILTRQRVFDAAVAEFSERGMADADLAAIAAAAGVSRGTFYFHFPTREHVLLALEEGEERRIASELSEFLSTPRDLTAILKKVIDLTVAIEERLGRLLFKDLLGSYFSPTRPLTDEWRSHPLIVLVATTMQRADASGEAEIVVDPYHSAAFFLLGLYALLTTTAGAEPLRTSTLNSYLTTTLRSLEPR
ncbi:TetR family transcriptional regulator [Rhodococcus sp. NPDC003322]